MNAIKMILLLALFLMESALAQPPIPAQIWKLVLQPSATVQAANDLQRNRPKVVVIVVKEESK